MDQVSFLLGSAGRQGCRPTKTDTTAAQARGAATPSTAAQTHRGRKARSREVHKLRLGHRGWLEALSCLHEPCQSGTGNDASKASRAPASETGTTPA